MMFSSSTYIGNILNNVIVTLIKKFKSIRSIYLLKSNRNMNSVQITDTMEKFANNIVHDNLT